MRKFVPFAISIAAYKQTQDGFTTNVQIRNTAGSCEAWSKAEAKGKGVEMAERLYPGWNTTVDILPVFIYDNDVD